jgi:hypothetical protein
LVEQQSMSSVQASASVLHATPGRVAQVPDGQSPEQHSVETPVVVVQAVPSALHIVSLQTPATQEPEAQSAPSVQAAPGSFQNASVVQRPASQVLEQQAELATQVAPGSAQAETGGLQTLVPGSQYPSQQSLFAAQPTPFTLQGGGLSQSLPGVQ